MDKKNMNPRYIYEFTFKKERSISTGFVIGICSKGICLKKHSLSLAVLASALFAAQSMAESQVTKPFIF